MFVQDNYFLQLFNTCGGLPYSQLLVRTPHPNPEIKCQRKDGYITLAPGGVFRVLDEVVAEVRVVSYSGLDEVPIPENKEK